MSTGGDWTALHLFLFRIVQNTKVWRPTTLFAYFYASSCLDNPNDADMERLSVHLGMLSAVIQGSTGPRKL